jgi:hypothetical protein
MDSAHGMKTKSPEIRSGFRALIQEFEKLMAAAAAPVAVTAGAAMAALQLISLRQAP